MKSLKQKQAVEMMIGPTEEIPASEKPTYQPREYPLVIKYMGSKAKILGFLSDGLNELGPSKLPILDLFAGSCAISGGFGGQHQIISNDIQMYSKVIASCYLKPAKKLQAFDIVKLASSIAEEALKNLPAGLTYPENSTLSQFNKIDQKNRELINLDFSSPYHLFTKNYSGTWWSAEQCVWIDALRQALDDLLQNKKILEPDYDLGLTSLMHAMAYASQGTGHYAQYRDAKTEASRKDINLYRQKSLPDLFAKKLKSLSAWNINNVIDLGHKTYALDYKECLSVSPRSVVYADPPYAFVHYSRFYHAMETLVKYDYPTLQQRSEQIVKGRYREDRHQSPFCIKSQVASAFSDLFQGVKDKKNHLILSYSNTGMIDLDELTDLASDELGKGYAVWSEIIDYNHMTMGRRQDRSREVQEAIIIAQKQ